MYDGELLDERRIRLEAKQFELEPSQGTLLSLGFRSDRVAALQSGPTEVADRATAPSHHANRNCPDRLNADERVLARHFNHRSGQEFCRRSFRIPGLHVPGQCAVVAPPTRCEAGIDLRQRTPSPP